MLGVERADVEARPLAPRPRRGRRGTTPSSCSRAGTRWSPSPDGRVRVTTTGVPWLATAGAGDVLAGLIGALLAAGLTPYDAASVGSWLHGAAATLASGDGPLVAGDVARSHPRGRSGCWRGGTDDPAGMEESAAMSAPSPAPRSSSTWRRSGTTSRLLRRAGGTGRDDDGGQGRRLRPRAWSRPPGPPGRPGRDWLGVATIDEALALRDGRRHRAGALLAGGARARTTPRRSRPTST